MNKVIFSNNNVQFIETNGHITNVAPSKVYTRINGDTVSFVFLPFAESSGLAFMTSLIKDLEIDGKVYTEGTILGALAKKFAEASAVHIKVKVVDELPTVGDEDTIYLLPLDDEEENNSYEEYLYTDGKWEKIGTTDINLSDYYTKSEVDSMIGDVGLFEKGKGDRAIRAKGMNAETDGNYSFAVGYGTVTSNNYEVAEGKHNLSNGGDKGNYGSSGNTLMSVGNGISTNRHNAFEVRQDGSILYADTNASGDYFEKPMVNLQGKLKDVDSSIAVKQDKLKAGENITISGDVISATVPEVKVFEPYVDGDVAVLSEGEKKDYLFKRYHLNGTEYEYPCENNGMIQGYMTKSGTTINEISGNTNPVTALTIGDCATSIEFAAFSDWAKLQGELNIPKHINSIGMAAFENCSGLTSITVDATEIGYAAFNKCRGVKNLTIGDNVRVISVGAFSNCSGLEGFLKIPDNVEEVLTDAFENCMGITSIWFGSGIKKIGGGYYSNKNLNEVYINAVTPPQFETSMPFNFNATIYVPQESVEAYKNVSYDFKYTYNVVGYNFD